MAKYEKVILIPSTLVVIYRNGRPDGPTHSSTQAADEYILTEMDEDRMRASYDAYGTPYR